MATLNQIAYRIFESIRPEIGDDDSIDIREIKYDIINQRSLWLKNEFSKNKAISEVYVQDLGCVLLENIDRAECCTVNIGCYIKRTTLDIPTTIDRAYGDSITRVGPVDKIDYKFNYIPFSKVPFVGNGRFNTDDIYAYHTNNRMYLTSNTEDFKFLKYANIRGVFQDPREASKFSTCSGATCYTDDDTFPISNHLINYIEAEIVKKYLGTDASMPADRTNDASPQMTDNINGPARKR